MNENLFRQQAQQRDTQDRNEQRQSREVVVAEEIKSYEVINVDAVKRAFTMYQRLEEILDDSDYTYFVRFMKDGKMQMRAFTHKTSAMSFANQVKGEVIRRKNKSAWRKLAVALNISTEIIKTERVKEDDEIKYIVEVKAYTRLGRCACGTGIASSKERTFVREHDILALAETRATNRAIANLIGFGETTAEEEGV